MSNKEFNKKFEEILKDLFGDRFRPVTPIDSFFNNIRFEDLSENIDSWKKFIKTSKDGLFTSIVYVYNPNEESEIFLDNKKKIKSLQRELDECVKSQNFERAAELRDIIKKISENKSRINELQNELEQVIKEQNFERAIEIRDELKKIN